MLILEKENKILTNDDLFTIEPSVKSGNDIVHIIKYMGSKKPILNFVLDQILDITNANGIVCDLFAGSCSISAGLRGRQYVISNDIQMYSGILARTYNADYSGYTTDRVYEEIEQSSSIHVKKLKTLFPKLFRDLDKIGSVESFAKFEMQQRELINKEFNGVDHYLFTKYYSGTYWSFQQCIWIDSLRKSAEKHKGTPLYDAIISSLMYAMSYTSQSTGHFAQYRDGSTDEAIINILSYRQKSIPELFKKKFIQLLNTYRSKGKELQTQSLDFKDCLDALPEGTTIYADPPYASVHYSRFYHALETLVRYDYPKLEHKGRYRMDRHQSPFSIKTKALSAFTDMFERIVQKNCKMVLSYSGTGVIPIDEILKLIPIYFVESKYQVKVFTLDHKHSTMGRSEDKDREVVEYLIVAKFL